MKKYIALFMIVLSCQCLADFISSKTSQVFHTRECRYAASLNETNSFIYEKYSDAIAAGKRVCLVCNPQPDIEEPDSPDIDENEVIINPPKEPSIIIPNDGVILGMDYCDHPYTAETVGKPIIVQQSYPITLREAIIQGKVPCSYFSQTENPMYPVIEPEEKIDPNMYLVDEHGRSSNYWPSYLYNLMIVFDYNKNNIQFLSARQTDWLENIYNGYKIYITPKPSGEGKDEYEYKDEYEDSWESYLKRPDGEAYDITLFLKKHIDNTLSSGKFVYGTMKDIQEYEIPELIAFQTILQYSLDYMKERFTLKIGEISYPIFVDEYSDKVNDNKTDDEKIVYTTYTNKYFHSKDCGHFNGIHVKMINRETGIIATNNAIWYPESGFLSWRITPFELGEYIAIANSDVGQTELVSINVRPANTPYVEDMNSTWLKGNFNMVKCAEFYKNFGNSSPRKITWVWEEGRWVPYVGVQTDGRGGRILFKEEKDIINEITEKYKTTKTYEKPISENSAIWMTTRVEISETTVIDYLKQSDTTPVVKEPVEVLSGGEMRWIFRDGNWILISKEGDYPDNPYINEYGFVDEEALLKVKPIAPIRPDPNMIEKEEETIKEIMKDAGDLKPFIEQIIKSSPSPKDAYEEKLIKYGAEYSDYTKKMSIWEKAIEDVRLTKEIRMEEEQREIDMEAMFIDDLTLLEEENKIQVLTDLMLDSRMNDAHKRNINEILNIIRANPATEDNPMRVVSPQSFE